MRYRPQIIWSDKSWVHNTFRVYESIFGRKFGIKKESATYLENGKLKIELYTFESTLAYLETLARNLFKINWLRIEVIQLQFAIPVNTAHIQIPFISFAIALDVADTGTTTSSSPLTWTHTVTGSNPFLAIGSGVSGASVPTTSAVTYNSASATKARSDSASGTVSGQSESSVWFKGNPSTGANTVSVSFSGSACVAGAVSYSGAQSTNTADAVGGTIGTSTGAKSFNVTTIADNCWVFACGTISGGTTPAWNTPLQTSRWSTTQLVANDNVGQDTNGPKTPAGAVTMGWTAGGTSGGTYRWAMTGASFAPSTGTTPTTGYSNSAFFDFMGPAQGYNNN